MLWLRLCLVAGFLGGVTGNGSAQDNASSLKTRFAQTQAGTRTLRAALGQTLQLGGMRRPAVSEATLYFQAPDKLAVVYSKPEGQELRALGNALWIKRRDSWTRKSLDTDLAGKPVTALLALLRGENPPDAKEYEESIVRDGPGWLVRLVPKGEPSGMAPRRIETRLVGDPPGLKSLTIFLPDDGVLVYELRDVRRNEPVDAAQFAEPTGKQ
jgi:outer membrane lipoprotein-sorting protein